MASIYKIINIITKQIYVGSTINFAQRKRQHLNQLRGKRHRNGKLQNSVNKYGIENFEFHELEELKFPSDYCKRLIGEHLICREIFYIENLNPFYNISVVRDSRLGHPVEAITRVKIGLAMKKRGIPPLMRIKSREALVGRKIPLSERRKMGRKQTRHRKVGVFDLEGNLLKIFHISSEAAEYYGIKGSAIRNNLCGLSNSSHGKVFKYID